MWRHRGVLWALGGCLAVAAALVFVRSQWSQVVQSIHGIAAVDPRLVAAGTACSLLAVLNRGALNHAAHRAVGADTGLAAITRTAAVGFAAQKMVKPAAAVGLAVFVAHGRRRGHAAAVVSGACAIVAMASFASLGLLLAVTVAVLAATGRLTGWWIAAGAGFGVYAVVIALVAAAACRGGRVTAWIWKTGSRLARRGTADDGRAPEFADAIRRAGNRRADVWRLAAHATASKALGVTMLLVAVTAIGMHVGPLGALVIYATAIAASTVSIVPGGFGAVEASTTALLVGAGATTTDAIVAVALFRLFDLWVPVLVGAVAGQVDVRRRRASGDQVVEAPAHRQPRPALIPLPALATVPAH